MQKNEVKGRRQTEAYEQEKEKGKEPLAHDHDETSFPPGGFFSLLFNDFLPVFSERHIISGKQS